MSASGSKKVIVLSLLANAGIAVSKLGGAFYTGSAALMAEAVHSFSDCGNQLLLLYGRRAAQKAPTEKYPLGRSREAFFWSFMVALLLFSLGGMFSLYEGIHKIQHPAPIEHPYVGVIILTLAAGLEAFSFWACYREVKKQNPFGSLWKWIRHTTSSDLLVIFLEDAAALIGLVFALIALSASWITGTTLWDGIGSIAIGLLLIVVAFILAYELKALLIGEAPSEPYRDTLEEILQAHMPGSHIIRLIALQVGIEAVMLAYKIHPHASFTDTMDTIGKVNAFERAVKERFPEIQWQFAELDIEQ